MSKTIGTGLGAAIFVAGLVIAATNAMAFSMDEATVCRLDPYGDNYLSLRSCRSTRCREIRRGPPRTRLLLLEPAGRWYQVQLQAYRGDRNYDGIGGFVYGRYVCPF